MSDQNKMRQRVRSYFELAKSGIVTLVVITATAGYLIAFPLENQFHPLHGILTLMGILLLSAGSSALNQIQDAKMDAKMKRTANRPLPTGRISKKNAWIFSLVCLVAGAGILAKLDGKLLFLGACAVIAYNGLYTLWWKRKHPYAAIPGSIPGALPVLMGAVTASGNLLSPVGWYLFLFLVYWQMPHFWVLALRYQDDYALGGVPTLPVAKGKEHTVGHIALWTLGYIALSFLGLFFLPVGWIYFGFSFGLGLWLIASLHKYMKNYSDDPKSWLPFFLKVTFSLVFYLGAAALDTWSIYLFLVQTR